MSYKKSHKRSVPCYYLFLLLTFTKIANINCVSSTAVAAASPELGTTKRNKRRSLRYGGSAETDDYSGSDYGFGGSSSIKTGSSSGYFSSSNKNKDKKKSSTGSSSSTKKSSKGSSYGSYGSSSGYGSYGSSSSSHGSYNDNRYQHEEPMIPLAWVILLMITSVSIGMLLTANEFISNSEGNLANFCRLSVNVLDCAWKIIYNCYHCRLSEIPNVVWAGDYVDDDDAYTEEELENMKCRPGIERALDVEHERSMSKMKKEFRKKTEMGEKIARKVGVHERGPGLTGLLGERKKYMKINQTEDE